MTNDINPAAKAKLPRIEGVDAALDLLRKAMTERGEDYVYKAPNNGECVYVHGGMPSCLVGHALALHGISTAEIHRREGASPLEFHEWMDEPARNVMKRAQHAQDLGMSWGNAVDAAVREGERF